VDGDDSLAPRFFHRVPRHERRVPRRAGRGQRRGEPAGDDGDRGRRRRGDQLRGVPGGLHGQRRAEDDAVRAHVPPIAGMHRPPPRRRPWALRHGPPLPRTTTPRPGVWRCRHPDSQTSRAKGTETMVDACFSSGGELSRRQS